MGSRGIGGIFRVAWAQEHKPKTARTISKPLAAWRGVVRAAPAAIAGVAVSGRFPNEAMCCIVNISFFQ
jgi:hypothetical protein